MLLKRRLEISQVLRWADAFREATGRWPMKNSGGIAGDPFETWARIDTALRKGLRGLDGGSSLAQLLAEQRGARNIHGLPDLTEEQVLAWADAHFQTTGEWPNKESGKVAGTAENWGSIAGALVNGRRGLPGSTTLAQLLATHRGKRNRTALPNLTEDIILAWADDHHARTGTWPTGKSGPVLAVPGETWTGVAMALCHGQRGMPGGSSLAWLLTERRGVGEYYSKPSLTVREILDWADNHYLRAGSWPKAVTEPIPEAPGETWAGIDSALKKGLRGLEGGISLPKLLAAERGVRNRVSVPDLTGRQVLSWADAHFRRAGDWPTDQSGPIPEAPGETWSAIGGALYNGRRGLRGGQTLAQFLKKHRGKRIVQDQPDLSRRQILEWADAHHARTGRWPRCKDGAIPEAEGETWSAVDNCLRCGLRGQPGGSSLTRLLSRKRGVRNPSRLPDLTEDKVLRWADAHQRRTGKWPTAESGPVEEVPGETWTGIDMALRNARRGLTGRSSLARLLEVQRGVRNKKNLPPLRVEEIIAWAKAHHARTGRWPSKGSGAIPEATGETWLGVDAALRRGGRTLPAGSSLARVLEDLREREKVEKKEHLAFPESVGVPSGSPFIRGGCPR